MTLLSRYFINWSSGEIVRGFRDYLGNEENIRCILSSIENNRIGHAYIVSGEDGIGKKAFAQSFAMELFCEDRQRNRFSCGECPECKKVLSGNHPNIFTVKTPEKTIKVDEIRRLIEKSAYLKDFNLKYRVCIINEAEKMTVQAQNTLLKSLEEPGEKTVFLLLTNNLNGILDTIRSRCISIRLKKRSSKQIRDFIETLPVKDKTRTDLAVGFCNGIPGRAEKMLRQDDNDEYYQTFLSVLEICRNISKADALEISGYSTKIAESSAGIDFILDMIRNWLRDLYFVCQGAEREKLFFTNEVSYFKNISKAVDEKGITAVLGYLDAVSDKLNANVNKELSVMLLLIKMREIFR